MISTDLRIGALHCLNEDPLVPVPYLIQLVDSTRIQPYGMVKDVLIEIPGSSAVVDFVVIDLDTCQQTTIILERPFLELAHAIINEKKGIVQLVVEGQHKKFTFQPEDPTSFYQVRILYQKSSDKTKHVEVLPYEPHWENQRGRPHGKGPKGKPIPKKKPDITQDSIWKSKRHVKPIAPQSPAASAT